LGKIDLILPSGVSMSPEENGCIDGIEDGSSLGSLLGLNKGS
jgi:hypothetical protein